MSSRTIKEIRDELKRLMTEQIASLKSERYGGLTREEILLREERLKRIREVSAEYLSALKQNLP
jgi:hypothetical protein